MPSDSLVGDVLYGVIGIPCIVDSLVILSLHQLSHSYRAVNLHDHSYVDFLNRGRGPEEMTTGFFSAVRKTDSATFLDITGLNEQVLYSIDMDLTLKSGTTIVREKTELLPAATVSYKTGNLILSEMLYDADYYSFKLYNTNQVIIKTDQPFGEDPQIAIYQPLYNAARRIKPDGTRLSLAMACFDEVNIYDIMGDKHLSVSTRRRTEDSRIVKEVMSTGRMSTHVFYWSSSVTEDSIYALYYDCMSSEMERTCPSVHVFSWDGTLKAVYHVGRSLSSIAVDEDEKTLYGLSWDEVIYTFKLG